MNWQLWAVGAILVLCVAAVVRRLLRRRRGTGCDCGCGGCPLSSDCNSRRRR